jgi:hypothetical protein
MYNAKKNDHYSNVASLLSGQQHGGKEIDVGLALNGSH